MGQAFFKAAALSATLVGALWIAGCKAEKFPTPQQTGEQKIDKANAKAEANAVVVNAPVPRTDDAALVIAACGSAASDHVVSVDDKTNQGSVRRLIYSGRREVALDFIPLQAGNGSQPQPSNTVWRFQEARVENQKLLTADNIRVYLPCAADALAKEF